MKTTALFLFLLCTCIVRSNAQVERLIAEIKSSNTIECYYLGQAGRPSQLFRKADTLMSLLSMKEKIELFSDSNKILKYYCFYSILTENDSIAFELLKQVLNDSSEVTFYCSCLMNEYAFNSLLVEKYSLLIESKYKYGLPTVMGDSPKVLMFPKANKKKYKQKRKQLLVLVNQSKNKEELVKHCVEWR